MHTLFALAPKLSDGPFCLATVDSVFLENEFREFIHFAKSDKLAHGILAVTDFIHDEKPLRVRLDSDLRILGFCDSHLKWATGGIYYFSPKIFDEIPLALEMGIQRLRNFLKLLISREYILKAFPFSKIIDIDHKSDIDEAEEFIRRDSRSY